MRYVVALGILFAAVESSFADPATASLHGVHFFDSKEGWAVGDDGVILHTIDGGRHWEEQTSGTRASLRGVTFLDESTGWIVGREERPFGVSVGVVLFTRDGGLRWSRLMDNALPGLNAVRFTDAKNGFLLGDGADPFASGVFRTSDGGKTWAPVKGTRTASWSAGDFQDGANGVFVGPWGKLATYRHEQWAQADATILAGRGLRDVKILNQRLLAVGESGLVLTSVSAGQAWGHADIKLPASVRGATDWNAIAVSVDRVWVVGRPGSVILRSDDGGATWVVKKTGASPMALHAVHFADPNHGCAVGAGGVVLISSDGGDTWTETRKPTRPETLVAVARADRMPFDVVAHLAAHKQPPATLAIARDEPGVAAPYRAMTARRLHTAVRSAGGIGAEQLSSFVVPQYLRDSPVADVVASWNAVHAGDAPNELLRQLVLALRMGQPKAVVVDATSDAGADEILVEAMTEAVKRAGDRQQYPEHIDALGLEPLAETSLVAVAGEGPYTISMLATIDDALTLREIGQKAQRLVVDRPAAAPLQRTFKMIGSGKTPSFVRDLAAGSTSKSGLRHMVHLIEKLPRSEVALTQLLPLIRNASEDDAARAAFDIAHEFVRLGEWDLARETFLLMVDRAPAHPLSAEAYRWLVQHSASGELKRRYDLRHFAVIQPGDDISPKELKKSDIQLTSATVSSGDPFPPFFPRKESRIWSKAGIDISKRVGLYGSLATTDPRVQFSVQSARRSLGEIGEAKAWHEKFVAHVPKGPWADAAAAELWLTGGGPRPRTLAPCRLTENRPHLDGKIDDVCWTSQPPITLGDASGASQADSPTQAWLAYDAEFLYVAVRCKHPVGRGVPPVKIRTRDADLDPFDRVSLLIDVDRDYASYFRLEFDQRGCVREDCWGDKSWNPKWYVSAHSTEDTWCVEAAIPIGEISSRPVTLDTRWACNLVRILPGRGVQSVSQPADVDPRPEGMCILNFHQDAKREQSPMSTVK